MRRLATAIFCGLASLGSPATLAFGASQAANYASGLAFNGLLAMFPLMLGILAIIGLSVRDPASEAKFQELIIARFPVSAQAELLRALHGVKDSAGLLGVVSIGGLIWTGSGVFATMEFAFAQIFGISQRDSVRQKLMGFVMMIVLIVAVGVIELAQYVTPGRHPRLIDFVVDAASACAGAMLAALIARTRPA